MKLEAKRCRGLPDGSIVQSRRNDPNDRQALRKILWRDDGISEDGSGQLADESRILSPFWSFRLCSEPCPACVREAESLLPWPTNVLSPPSFSILLGGRLILRVRERDVGPEQFM